MILLYLLTAIGLTPGGSSTVHIYTQTLHRTTQITTRTQLTTEQHNFQQNNTLTRTQLTTEQHNL